MKSGKFLPPVAVVISILAFAQAPTPTYSRANFPYSQTLMAIHGRQYPGCTCGIGTNDGALAKSMSVSPTSIQTTVGQPVTLRYDASLICRKQTIANLNGKDSTDPNGPTDDPNLNLGTADWQVGTPQWLPREWGQITYPGYTQSGTYTAKIDIKVQCKDIPHNCPHGYNLCNATVSVPIAVQ